MLTTTHELCRNVVVKADYRNLNFEKSYFQHVLNMIIYNTSLKFFDFENSNIDDTKLRYLVRVLVLRNSSINELNLNNTRITLTSISCLKQLINLTNVDKIILSEVSMDKNDNLVKDLQEFAMIKRVMIHFN